MDAFLRLISLAAVVAIGVLSLVPGDLRPHTELPSQVEHIAAYALVAAVVSWAYCEKLKPIRIAIILTCYGALLEICQIWIPGRNPRLIDAAADAVGAICGVGIASMLLFLRRKRST